MHSLQEKKNGKQIFNLLKSGKGFSNPLQSGLSLVGGKVSSLSSLSSSISSVNNPAIKAQLAAAGLTTGVLSNFTSSLGSVTSTTKTLVDYGQKSVEEFSQRMHAASNYMSTLSRMGEKTSCSIFSDVMSVATDLGKKAMDAVNSAMDAVNDVMSQLQDAINKGLNTISSLASKAVSAINKGIQKMSEYASQVTKMIEDEAKKLADYLKTSAEGFLADILPDWFNDSCKSGIVDQIATPEMKEVLKK